MRKYGAWMVVILAVFMLAIPAAADAQEECGKCKDLAETHLFGAGGAWFRCNGSGSVGCHDDEYYGMCGDYHWSSGGVCDQVEPGALEVALKAVESSDAEPLEALLMGYPEYVRLNAERGSLDVVTCFGALRARFELPEELLIKLNDS